MLLFFACAGAFMSCAIYYLNRSLCEAMSFSPVFRPLSMRSSNNVWPAANSGHSASLKTRSPTSIRYEFDHAGGHAA